MVANTIETGLDKIEGFFNDLKSAGVDFDAVTKKLQTDGVELFQKSYHSLLNSVEDKVKTMA